MEITKRNNRPQHHDTCIMRLQCKGRKKRRNKEYKDTEQNRAHDIQPLHAAFDLHEYRALYDTS